MSTSAAAISSGDRTGLPVLEDTTSELPPAISYSENRIILTLVHARPVSAISAVLPVYRHAAQLLHNLARAWRPARWPRVRRPNVVLLTPVMFKIAYFEHADLCAPTRLGIELVKVGTWCDADNCAI